MRVRTFLLAAGAAVLTALALLRRTFSASPLPKPEPYMGSLSSGTPPKEMAVFSVVTGVNHRVAGFGYRGGSLFERREFSMAGTLAFGHTPGSVIIFVTLPSGTRYAFVGDVVYQLEGITLREERPWLVRRKADTDAKQNRENLLRMVALKERLPELIIVPAHDIRAFSRIPPLSPASREGTRIGDNN